MCIKMNAVVRHFLNKHSIMLLCHCAFHFPILTLRHEPSGLFRILLETLRGYSDDLQSCYITLRSVFPDRSLMAKKVDGIKESTDCNATIEDDDPRGWLTFSFNLPSADFRIV